jgi:hypothetical protein
MFTFLVAHLHLPRASRRFENQEIRGKCPKLDYKKPIKEEEEKVVAADSSLIQIK